MEKRDTLAVVDDRCFYNLLAQTDSVEYEDSNFTELTLASLLTQAERLKYTHVWVVPGTELSRKLSAVCDVERWELSSISKKGRYSFLSARRPGQRHEENIYVGFPEFSGWPWSGDDDPKVLLKTIIWLENALGLPLQWTAPHMSLAYVRKMNESRWSWLAPLTLDLEKETPGFSYDQ